MSPESRGDIVFLLPEFCVRYFDGESLETVAGRLRDELMAGGAIALRHGLLVSTALDAGQSKAGRLRS